MDDKKLYGSDDCGGYDNIDFDRKSSSTHKIILGIVAFVIFYCIFIYAGYSSTTFRINEDGTKEALVVDLEARAGQENYENLKLYYNIMYAMFQDIYSIEKNINEGEYDSFSNYTKNIETLGVIDSYMQSLSTLSIDEKYVDIRNDMYNCFNSLAIYYQKINVFYNSSSYNDYYTAYTWLLDAEKKYYSISNLMLEFGHSVQIYNDKDLAWYESKTKEELENQEVVDPNAESLIEIKGEETGWEEVGFRTGEQDEEIETNEPSELTPEEMIESIMNSEKDKQTGGYGNPIQ